MSLSQAVIYGTSSDVVRWLRSGIDVNYIDEYGYTPLIQAAIVNDINKANTLLNHGADVHKADLTGRTALHWAVDNHNLPFCRVLLNHGADPSAYTSASEPILVKPILRQQKELQQLLLQFGADLTFAQDFIYGKLIGHRFELRSQVDIVDTNGKFTELDFEGFFLEFTLGIIKNSLQDYINNFAARHMRPMFKKLKKVIKALSVASELIKYQQYLVDIEEHRDTIDNLLKQDPLIIPVAYEGHAVTFIKVGNLWARCDRGHNENFIDNVVIYRVNRPSALNGHFIRKLIYKKQTADYIDNGIIAELSLEPVTRLMIDAQVTGNCSWANVEASVPTLFVMLSMRQKELEIEGAQYKKAALSIFKRWCEWDKDRALHFFLAGFDQASPARKASIASIVGAVLFQRCSHSNARDMERAKKIVPILKTPGYEYILKNYIEIYCHYQTTEIGTNLRRLLKAVDVPWLN